MRAMRLGAADYPRQGPRRLPAAAAGRAGGPGARKRGEPRDRHKGSAAGGGPLARCDRAQVAVFSATPRGAPAQRQPRFSPASWASSASRTPPASTSGRSSRRRRGGGAPTEPPGTAERRAEVRLRRADGRTIWVEVIGTARPRRRGATRIDGLVEDVTARKEAEDESARQSAQLRRATRAARS